MSALAFRTLLIRAFLLTNSTGTVTSYVRSPSRNAAVGGVPNSLHLVGLAADVAGDTARAAALWRQAGLDAIEYATHTHFELDGPLLRWRGPTP